MLLQNAVHMQHATTTHQAVHAAPRSSAHRDHADCYVQQHKCGPSSSLLTTMLQPLVLVMYR